MSTYTPIASVTLSSAQSSVTFSGIPQTYTDLVIVASGLGTVATTTKLNVGNGSIDTGSNYSWTVLSGTGSAANSYRESNVTFTQNERYANWDTTNNANTIIQIMNYSNSTTYKTWLSRGNNAATGVDAIVGLWRNTSAINTVQVSCTNATTFKSGSTFNLYGVANASITNVAKATGGDSVYTDGTYWYHIFRSSGTFTPTQALTADYLVVAGGGGGGAGDGITGSGGGGAGGYRTSIGGSGLSCTAQNYTVTVGAGGAGGISDSGITAASNGSDSVFSTITSTGGGRGASFASGGGRVARAAGNGGSGGGGALDGGQGSAAGTGNTPSTSPSQGNNGGTENGAVRAAGGGGGSGGTGGNATTSPAKGGDGGAGTSNSITGTSVTYAGGGGGGASSANGFSAGSGGSGGGGNGSSSGSGNNGSANLGGGGGGQGNNTSFPTGATGGNGGSGIVVIRYSAAA